MLDHNEKQEYIDKIMKRHDNLNFNEDGGILISMVWDDARSALRKNILEYFYFCEDNFEQEYNEADLYRKMVSSLKILLKEKE